MQFMICCRFLQSGPYLSQILSPSINEPEREFSSTRGSKASILKYKPEHVAKSFPSELPIRLRPSFLQTRDSIYDKKGDLRASLSFLKKYKVLYGEEEVDEENSKGVQKNWNEIGTERSTQAIPDDN